MRILYIGNPAEVGECTYMCYDKHVGHRVMGPSREGRDKANTPTRPPKETITQQKRNRLRKNARERVLPE